MIFGNQWHVLQRSLAANCSLPQDLCLHCCHCQLQVMSAPKVLVNGRYRVSC